MTADAEALQWWWSEDEERCHGPFDSREDALAGAHDGADDEATEVEIFTASRRPLRDDIFRADEEFERFEEHNEECWGEDGPNMRDVPVAAVRELEVALMAAFARWRERYAPWSSWTIENFANRETVKLVRAKAEGGA